MMQQGPPSLVGQLLIAMPALSDPNFWRTVVLLGVHSVEEGAFGLIINRRLDVDANEILDEIGEAEHAVRRPVVLGGGPVQPTHGFVLFEGEVEDDDETLLRIGSHITLSGSTRTLSDLVSGRVDGRFYLLLGYSGWAPGQLEKEIEENSWLVAPGNASIIFDTPVEDRWAAALQLLGVDPGTLVDAGATQPS